MNEYGCQHCENMHHINQVDMVGSYVANLCADCRNQFEVFIRDNPVWIAFMDCESEAQMILAMTHGDSVNRIGSLRELLKYQRSNKEELHDICRAWVRGEIEN